MCATTPDFHVDCPSRLIFEQIADKWSMMIMASLNEGPVRFNGLKRRLEGVTQKSLTQCLRRLERNGLVERRVVPVSPVAVEYALTDLGRSLQPRLLSVYAWTVEKMQDIEAARLRFDAKVMA